MKPKRKILSLLLVICLVAGLMPTAVFAAGTDTGKAIQLGTSGISGYDSAAGYDYIYFGSWTAQDTYTTSGPIKWRVLDDQTNTGGTGLFLLSDGLLGTGYYGGVYFDNTSPYSNTWQGSDAQAWCNTLASSNLDSRELAAILETTKSDDAFTSSTYSVPFAASENILNGDKVFFLSAEEAENSAYGFANDNARIANYGGSACAWWLRSPYAYLTNCAGAVYGYGNVDYINVDGDWAARPAFNLDLNSVLFTSAAEGGKIPAANGGGNQGGEAADAIFEIGDYDGNEWKLTLLDSSREFGVTEETASGKPGDTITLNYSGATTGTNEYISVIIADNSGAQYYGRVAQPTEASGQIQIKIPASLADGTYTLNVFSEQYNGDYKTDYASAFAEVALTVEEAAAPGIDTGKAIQLVDSGTVANISGGQADNIYFGTYQQSSDGSVGYNTDPIKWRVLENAGGQLFLISDQNLDVFQYHTDLESITWERSTMRSWLNGYGAAQNTGSDNGIDYTDDNFIDTAFSDGEQGAIVDTTVVNDDNPDHNTEGGENTNDKIFLLSVDEARNSSYFADDNSRIATNTAYVAGGGKIGGYVNGVGENNEWWLRSPGSRVDLAASVLSDGGVFSYGFYVDYASYAVRPAFNLDLTSVLFTSAAAGGKSASGMDSGLTAVGDYDGNEWKLTLLDDSRNFAAATTAVTVDTLTLSYSGAATGANEYISAIIKDNSGNITHYGRLKNTTEAADASGTVNIDLSGIDMTSKTLYVFSEQYNGGADDNTKLTDYASELVEVSQTKNAYAITNNLTNISTDNTAAYRLMSEMANYNATLTADTNYTLPATITVEVGGAALTPGTGYTYSGGSLTIPAVSITGDIAITAAGVATHAHSWATAWTTNATYHWHECETAGCTVTEDSAKDGYGAHTAGDWIIDTNATANANGSKHKECTACGYVMETAVIPATGGGGGSTTDYYRLTFETNGGSEISSIRRAEYTTIDLTDYTPTREGYEFTGWYADENLTEKITSIRLTRNTTVYAGWEEIKENPSTGFENPFTDVSESDWFFNDVKFVYQNGLMNGTSATTFSPEGTTSRGMIVTILWRMAGSPDMEDKIWGYPFADVDATAYYGTAVYWARLNGIAGGYGGGLFGPEDNITREQLATILYRYAQYKGYDVSAKADLNKFTDADEISNYALEALQWANAEGLINGKGDGVLDPKGQATRAEAAVILTRFNEVVAE